MPAYNEKDSIAEAVRCVTREVLGIVPDAEIVVVDDGSTDCTAEILARLAREVPELRVVRQKNGGHGQALLRGIAEAHGAWLLLLDSDCQIDLAAFEEHWEQASSGKRPVVFGIRQPRRDPAHRRLLSMLMRGLILLRFGVAPADANAPYKLLPRHVWEVARVRIGPDSMVPSVLLAIYAVTRQRNLLLETEVHHLPRKGEPSTLNFSRLVRLSSRAIGEVWRFRP